MPRDSCKGLTTSHTYPIRYWQYHSLKCKFKWSNDAVSATCREPLSDFSKGGCASQHMYIQGLTCFLSVEVCYKSPVRQAFPKLLRPASLPLHSYGHHCCHPRNSNSSHLHPIKSDNLPWNPSEQISKFHHHKRPYAGARNQRAWHSHMCRAPIKYTHNELMPDSLFPLSSTTAASMHPPLQLC